MDRRRWTARIGTAVITLGMMLHIVSCAVDGNTEKTADLAQPQTAPVRTGFYVGSGSRSNGVLHWARLLAYSPQLKLVLIDAEDVLNGRLKDLDLLVVPGGSSRLQCETMKPEGMEKVRDFVAAGGSYAGFCAGFHCTLNRPERLRLMPYEYCQGAGGNLALLAVDISEKGGKVMGVKPGRYMVRYSHGPISKPGKQPGEGWGETLGVYKSTVGPVGRPGGNFFDAPAVIHGKFGKGKVIATSFHPESYQSSHPIALGCIYAVTGVRPAPVFPAKNPRPVRVGYYGPGIAGKYCIRAMLALDRHPDLDVILIDGVSLNQGMLDHLDVFVLPHGIKSTYKGLFTRPFPKEQIVKFLRRGGLLLASGNAADYLPDHPNAKRLPADADFVKEALTRR